MRKTNIVDEKTRKYRELMDQIIVQVKDVSVEEHDEPFKSWFLKNNIILDEIERLKNDKDERSKISAFILDCEYIEFKIIDLLQKLELLVRTDPKLVKYNGKKLSKELYKLPLGSLYKELCNYQTRFLVKLIPMVEKLNKLRIRFVHYLFTDIKGIDKVIKEAIDGLAYNDKVIEALYLVHKHIQKNTWYGQMMERKRLT